MEYVVSDDHAGLRAARRAVLGGAKWQRCQFHLAQNAVHHAPSLAIRKRIGAELRAVWNAPDLPKAETALAELVAAYSDTAPKLAEWLEKNVPEGLTVFALPEHHRRRLRTSNPPSQRCKHRLPGSDQARHPAGAETPHRQGQCSAGDPSTGRLAFPASLPSEESLERLTTAVLVEIDERWAVDTKAYIKWECQDA